MFKTRKMIALALSILVSATGLNSSAADNELDVVYRLAAGDRIRVTVYGHEDLSGEFEVNGAGQISLPLVHEVKAAGLSASELAAAITDKLSPDYLRNPQVTTEVLGYRPFYIIGEVKSPGSYAYANGMTVINAVAVAGGFTYRARKNKIKIVRGSEPDQEEIVAEPDTYVLPGDVIEVAERFF